MDRYQDADFFEQGEVLRVNGLLLDEIMVEREIEEMTLR